MRAMQMLARAQEVTANNLANINTSGFKSDKLHFRAFMDKVNGENVSSVEAYKAINMGQGTLEKTGNPFDFAIQGTGFFEVQKDGQFFLKRAGHFKLDARGFLVDEQGAAVMGKSGPIQLPAFADSGSTRAGVDVEVAKDGTITVNDEAYGQLSMVQISDPQKLERRGNSYFRVPENMPAQAVEDDVQSQIMQGYQESGNVNPLAEMVDMTKNMRLFESQQRAMRTTNEMLTQASTRLGKF
jgi:flagellar basal body rod protein FlgG